MSLGVLDEMQVLVAPETGLESRPVGLFEGMEDIPGRYGIAWQDRNKKKDQAKQTFRLHVTVSYFIKCIDSIFFTKNQRGHRGIAPGYPP